jgi:hypothetical protein
MTTHVTTEHPARTDLATAVAPSATDDFVPAGIPTSTRWAWAGVVAGLAGVGTMVATSMVSAIYDPKIYLDANAIQDRLGEQTTPMLVFQIVSSVGALAMVVFAAGLHRRLRTRLGDSLAPTIALAGLAGTAVVTVLGGGLNTEFISGVHDKALPASSAMYNHWIGTIPWCWLLAGLSALAVFSAARRGAVPRWMGIVSLVLGGLTVLAGTLPIQYIAIVPGSLWLLILSVGFLVGDKSHRDGAHRSA